MPQFPTSKYSASPAAGTFVRAQGSHSPMVEAEVGIPDFVQHPFRITTRTDSGGASYAKVRAGTVNNIVPTIGGVRLDAATPPELGSFAGTATHKIYLLVEKGASPVFFPTTATVIVDPDDQVDTDDEGYLLLGTVTTVNDRVTSVNQYVYASQVLVRAKPGDDTALWLWSSR